MARSTCRLRLFERLIGGLRARESRRDLLPDLRSDRLEFRDRHELHAGVGHGIHGRMGDVGDLDRLQHRFREGAALMYSGLA